MAVKYKVVDTCYYNSMLHTPDGPRNTITVAEPFDPCPPCLKPLTGVEVVDDEDTHVVRANKSAATLAEENNIDLQLVVGTGKDGAITKPDVQKYIDARKAADDDGDEDGDGDGEGDGSGEPV